MNLKGWCTANPAGLLKPSDDLFTNGFNKLTVGENRWLNYLFNLIIPHCQVPTSSVVAFLGATVSTQYSGYVLADGSTIASSTGSADINSDEFELLYKILWRAGAPVVGKGSDADADWTANKPLTLPNLQGLIMVGQQDSGIFSGLYTTVGAEGVVLTIPQIPSHSHSLQPNTMYEAPPGNPMSNDSNFGFQRESETGSTGNDEPHPNVQPSFVMKLYLKY